MIQFGTRTVKGYLESPAWNTIEELLSGAPLSTPEILHVRLFESNSVEEISIKDVKAIFYVHNFDGDANHKEMSFYGKSPIVHGIWMRVQFLDGEVIEGIVHNSIRYLVDPGFFLVPTHPGSNNKLIYVSKSQLADHRVLGTRNLNSVFDSALSGTRDVQEIFPQKKAISHNVGDIKRSESKAL
ncbi:MAG: hypothetical protein ABSA42_10400 [Terracidiphilus sp.]